MIVYDVYNIYIMSNHLFRIKNTYFELLDNYTLDIIFDMMLNDYLIEHKKKFHASFMNLEYQFFSISYDLLQLRRRKMIYEDSLMHVYLCNEQPPSHHKIKMMFNPTIFLLELKIKKKYDCDYCMFLISERKIRIKLIKNEEEFSAFLFKDPKVEITQNTLPELLRKILETQPIPHYLTRKIPTE